MSKSGTCSSYDSSRRLITCAAPGCVNTSHSLKQLNDGLCTSHPKLKRAVCGCPPPFYWRMFPDERGHTEKCSRLLFLWLDILQLGEAKNYRRSDLRRVCSDHFNLDATAKEFIPVLKVNRSLWELSELCKLHKFTLDLSKMAIDGGTSSAESDTATEEEQGRPGSRNIKHLVQY